MEVEDEFPFEIHLACDHEWKRISTDPIDWCSKCNEYSPETQAWLKAEKIRTLAPYLLEEEQKNCEHKWICKPYQPYLSEYTRMFCPECGAEDNVSNITPAGS